MNKKEHEKVVKMRDRRTRLAFIAGDILCLQKRHENLLKLIRKQCEHKSIIAYYHTSGEISTFCSFCGLFEKFPFSDDDDWKKEKEKVVFVEDGSEFTDRKNELHKKLGIGGLFCE